MLQNEVDKLTYEIFSILENKFLFGYNEPKNSKSVVANSAQISQEDVKSAKHNTGKIRILCIDGTGATNGILAAKSLVHLKACLYRKSKNPNAHITAYFDVVAGSGVRGVLAALLFTRGRDGFSMFSAEEALNFLVENRHKIFKSKLEIFWRVIRLSSSATKVEKLLRKIFDESTPKDTLKPVLIPCYDFITHSPTPWNWTGGNGESPIEEDEPHRSPNESESE